MMVTLWALRSLSAPPLSGDAKEQPSKRKRREKSSWFMNKNGFCQTIYYKPALLSSKRYILVRLHFFATKTKSYE
jgi:hypothetical protein